MMPFESEDQAIHEPTAMHFVSRQPPLYEVVTTLAVAELREVGLQSLGIDLANGVLRKNPVNE
jgi:hypothetical protein